MSTTDIRVEPVTLRWAEALKRADAEFERAFGSRVEPGWLAFPGVVPVFAFSAVSRAPLPRGVGVAGAVVGIVAGG